MPKIVEVQSEGGEENRLAFHCPGCGCAHWFRTKAPAGMAVWTWNGDVERPTIRASILVKRGSGHPRNLTCHSYVTDGMIQFLGDSEHELAGQTVPLPEF